MDSGLDRTLDRKGAITPPGLKLVGEPAAAPARSRFHGLSAVEVEARRQQGLSNGVDLGESRTYREILRQNAFTFINIVLFAISTVLGALGLWGDALATAGLVLINVAVAVIQEARAKQTLDHIALLTRPEATVTRDGEERRVDPADVVLGDLLVLRPGDQAIVDGEILTDGAIEVDESLLTGEAEAVRKRAGDSIYSGSFCVSGTANYVARHVGAASMANQLTQRARSFRQVKTPLQRDIDLIIRIMILLVVAVSGPVVFDVAVRLIELVSRAVSEPFANAVADAYQGFVFEETVKAAAVIVALVPQGLVLMIAVTYAAAAIRLAGKGALIQQANAIESLSHVDVFCLDKTGTLTTNRLQVDHITAIGIPESDLERALADFVASASDQNRTAAAISAAYPGTIRHKRDEISFSSARKWSAVAFDDPHRPGVYLLGAAEAFGAAVAQQPEVERLIAGGAKRGLRMLLFGRAASGSSLRDTHGEPIVPPTYQPIGVIALRDELRPEAGATLHQLLDVGAEIKIISGDDPRTVAALATQAGLPGDIGIASGLELRDADDELFAKLVRATTIFGRITPLQKERIVRVLQAQGHYVAMTGDGVNDVPALKQADLGIAVRSGSAATRAVADLVLLHDSFAVLPAALREGQRIVGGMQDIIKLFLVRSLTVVTVVIGAALADATFPITPRHNALLAMMTVGIPTFALAMWSRPGQARDRLLRNAVSFVAMAVLTISPIALLTFLYALRITDTPEMARTVLTTTAIFCGLVLVLFVEPPTRRWVGGDQLSGDWRPAILAFVLLLVYIAMLWTPKFRRAFELEPIGAIGMIAIGAVVLLWALGLRWLWRQRVFERFLGLPADA